MDIEFIVQDVFALTRPQWKLASNLEEASRAFQLAMVQDQKTAGIDKAVEPEDVDSDGLSEDGIGDGDAEADTEVGVGEAEAEEESESESEAADVSYLEENSPPPRFLMSKQADSNNGETALSAPGTDSEDEAIVVTRQEEEVDPEDEADFEREYAKMMAESLESRKHERKATFDVPLPMRRKEATTSNESWADESTSLSTAPSGTMAFSLLTKRGNRQQVSSQRRFSVNQILILTVLDSHCGSTLRFYVRDRHENTTGC
jgi:regulator of nonsense transcripts 2